MEHQHDKELVFLRHSNPGVTTPHAPPMLSQARPAITQEACKERKDGNNSGEESGIEYLIHMHIYTESSCGDDLLYGAKSSCAYY
eukprot:1141695-Pelagomonas_calceolata.AAC.7